jgi:hypothetical protein
MRIFLFIFCLAFLGIFKIDAQAWIPIDESSIESDSDKVIRPFRFQLYEIDDEEIRTKLWNTPHEREMYSNNREEIIRFPLYDGSMDDFSVVEYSMMEEQLARKYDYIKTFWGKSVSNAHRIIRIDYTLQGVRAVISEPGGKTYIDHFLRGEKQYRIVYKKMDIAHKHDWQCMVEDNDDRGEIDRNSQSGQRAGDCVFRTYRLAQATTGEYSNYHGAFDESDSGLVMSAVTTTINRVNEVYEQDITVRFILVNNTDELFFYDPDTDPYTNNNGSQMLGQNITTCDNIIGNPNYDIGHVFSTGGGGVAYLNAVCNNSIKAGGVTGLPQPEGEPFDIDYVSHEIGHQFGGRHTQNNNCNRSAIAAREPGSASTIMGYAGICAPNVQNNSDAYFHAYSIQEMSTRITTTNCHTAVAFANNAPIVQPLQNYHIPRSTPFVLTATATDPDDDPLIYNWEQMDNEVAPMPPQPTNAGGPTFRSKFATVSPSRYFPPLSNIANQTSNTWEVLPSVARTMNFRVTVRDMHDGNLGCTDEQDMVLTVVGTAGPFVITSQNTATNWNEGDTETISWNVANTNVSPISCTAVDILWSTDGGLTWNQTIAENLSNSGSASIVVPAGLTTQGRFMVKGRNNVFFDINNANINVNPGGVTFVSDLSPATVAGCNNSEIQTTVNTTAINGFNESISFNIPNLPAGVQAIFVPAVVSPGMSSELTISGLEDYSGEMILEVVAQGGSVSREMNFTINLIDSQSGVSLIQPANNAQNVHLYTEFSWTQDLMDEAIIQLATDESFEDIVYQDTTELNSLRLSFDLIGDMQYYWRVQAANDCGGEGWSEVRTFGTEKCGVYRPSDLPIIIPSDQTFTAFSDLPIEDSGIVNDIDVVGLQGLHTWIWDLDFQLSSPNNTDVLFWDQPCWDEDDFFISFDDEATSGAWPCPPTDGLFYQPDENLSSFDNVQMNGLWRLRVRDNYNQDGGSLEAYSVKACANDLCRLTVDNVYYRGVGSLKAAVDCALPGQTITFAANMENNSIDLRENAIVIDKNLNIIANPDWNIFVGNPGDQAVITIEPGVTVTIEGLRLGAGSSIHGAIRNRGTLILRDVIIYKDGSFPLANSYFNEAGAFLRIEGDCIVE